MLLKNVIGCSYVIAGSLLLAFSSTSAATLTWDTAPGTVGPGNGTVTGGAGTWNTSNGNWTVDGGANNIAWVNGNNDTAVFGGTAGTVTLGANVTVGGLTFNTNSYTIAPGSGPFGITFGTTSTVNVSTGASSVSAAISGSGIVKSGAGTLTLSGSNSFGSGTLTFGAASTNSGAIRLASANALGNYTTVNLLGGTGVTNRIELTGGLTFSTYNITTGGRNSQTGSGAALANISGNNTWQGSIAINATGGAYGIRSDADLLTLNGEIRNDRTTNERAWEFTGAGDIRVNGALKEGPGALALSVLKTGDGSLTLAGANTYIGTTTISSGTLVVASSIASSSTISNNAFLIFNSNSSQSYANVISGSGSLAKQGSGVLTLSGSNSYTGATSVSGGTLIVNGDQSLATETTTVAAGATLGGSGTLGGALAIDGLLAPGNSIGTLNVNSDVTWNGSVGNDWVFELGPGNTSDLLDITGNFIKGTGSVFNFDFADSTATGSFTLVTWTGGTSSFDASNFTYANLGGGNTGTFNLTGSELQFVVIVPEPRTLAMLAVGAAIVGLRLTRRRSRAALPRQYPGWLGRA